MPDNQTDEDWEYFGKNDPYWAVVTNESFHQENLDENARDFFFRTGEDYINNVFDVLHSRFALDFVPERALDFGCGVGRLVVSLAQRCKFVVGVDVSDSMLQEAASVVKERNVSNVSFVKGDDNLSNVSGDFDFINSYIVLQHIPTDRGAKIVGRLIDLLRDGGVGVLHLTYSKEDLPQYVTAGVSAGYFTAYRGNVRKVLGGFYRSIKSKCKPLFSKLTHIQTNGREECKTPEMQMNLYNLNYILHAVQKAGVKRMHLEFSNHSGTYGAILFFMKTNENKIF